MVSWRGERDNQKGRMAMPVFKRPDAEIYLAESIRRVTDFLTRHTP